MKNAYDPQFNVDGVWDKKASDKAEDLNLDFQYEILNNEAYQNGEVDTDFIPTYFPQYCRE